MMRRVPIITGSLVLAVLLGGCQSTSKSRLADGEPLPINTNDPAAIYLELATTYLEQGQPGAALVNTRKAISLDPDNAEGFIVQGMAQSSLGHIPDAEESYRQALEKSSGSPYAANAYGTFLCNQGRTADAVVQFDAAAASPRNTAPWVAITNSAICLSDEGNTGGAKERFLRALQVNSRFGPAMLGLARLYYNSKDYAQARTYVNGYFEAVAPDPESLWLAYRIEKALGNSRAAESFKLMLETRYPDAPQTYRLMGL